MSAPTGSVVVIDGISYQVDDEGKLALIPPAEGGAVVDQPYGGEAAARLARSKREYFSDEEWRDVQRFAEPQGVYGNPMEAARFVRSLADATAFARAVADPDVAAALAADDENAASVDGLTQRVAALSQEVVDLKGIVAGLEQDAMDADEKHMAETEALAVADAVLQEIIDTALGEGITADTIVGLFVANFDADTLKAYIGDKWLVENADGTTEIVTTKPEPAPKPARRPVKKAAAKETTGE